MQGWLPWQRGSATCRVSSELTSLTPTSPTPPLPAVTPLALSDAATPQGWIYDGGFVLFQVNHRLDLSVFVNGCP